MAFFYQIVMVIYGIIGLLNINKSINKEKMAKSEIQNIYENNGNILRKKK